jgi:hypothetical protein
VWAENSTVVLSAFGQTGTLAVSAGTLTLGNAWALVAGSNTYTLTKVSNNTPTSVFSPLSNVPSET